MALKDWFWIPCAMLGGVFAIGDYILEPRLVGMFHGGLLGFYGSIALSIILRWLEARE